MFPCQLVEKVYCFFWRVCLLLLSAVKDGGKTLVFPPYPFSASLALYSAPR